MKRQHHHWHTIAGGAGQGPVSNIIVNGTFAAGTTGWTGFGFSGKAVTGGQAVFTATPAFDGISQGPVAITAGKYYEVVFTLVVTSGNLFPYLSGGAATNGTARSASGTYTERLLATSGNNTFGLQSSLPATLTIDDISVVGPYDGP